MNSDHVAEHFNHLSAFLTQKARRKKPNPPSMDHIGFGKFDHRFITRVPQTEPCDANSITRVLALNGAPAQCVILEQGNSARVMSLRDGVEFVAKSNEMVVASCVPGRLALYRDRAGSLAILNRQPVALAAAGVVRMPFRILGAGLGLIMVTAGIVFLPVAITEGVFRERDLLFALMLMANIPFGVLLIKAAWTGRDPTVSAGKVEESGGSDTAA